MRKLLLSLSPLALGLALLVPAQGQGLPAGKGLDTYEAICGSCHGADIVSGAKGSRALWEETVESMRSRGAYGSDEEFEIINNYLAKYFGNDVNVNEADAEVLAKEFILTPEKAEAIVAYRDKNGNFTTFADFVKAGDLDEADFKLIESRIKFQ